MIQSNTTSIEKDLRLCKCCREIKVRILDGRYPNNRDKKFVDENGKKWNGSICAECHKKAAAERARSKHEKQVVDG